MVSSGLFILPGLAYAIAGPAMILSYVLASLLMVPVMLSKVELATAMPKSGGSYFYIGRSMGPLIGTIAGLANWMSIALKSAFAMIGIGAIATVISPALGESGVKAFALGACAVFTVLNLTSTKYVGRLQVFLVIALLGILVLYMGKGVQFIEGTRYIPFADHGWHAVLAATGMVFISFGGLTKVVDVSEEIHNPTRNIPLGMVSAFLIVSALYVIVLFVTVGVVSGEMLAGSLVPISLGADAVMGHVGALLVDAAALFAFATTANAGILSAARSPMAMSRDGLLPKMLSRSSKRFGTPYIAIGFTAVFLVTVITLLSIEDLVKTASTMMLLIFMLDNISVIIMRQSGLQNYRPTFKAPLYPWLQIGALIIYVFIIIEMGPLPMMLTGGFALASAAWYFIYVGKRIQYESAFVHMVKRIVAKRVDRSGLEDELRQITLERDQVVYDRFDLLVSKCTILDVEGPITAKHMFRTAAEALSPRLEMKEDCIYQLLLDREKESSTVIRPGLAIPHIIVEGKGIFDLLLVRCKEGVVFSELNPLVTTMFILIGSLDERNFHLRTLMTVAHIVQEPGFQERWQQAPDADSLRDIILLSSRIRQGSTQPR
ncbi:MAG: amino acid permease [Candidatus Hydrogenedentes bacterium]|nr:amino acid permease [Candidatus Hydrogenedentota bacterium]